MESGVGATDGASFTAAFRLTFHCYQTNRRIPGRWFSKT